jgi:hypothetical protein
MTSTLRNYGHGIDTGSPGFNTPDYSIYDETGKYIGYDDTDTDSEAETATVVVPHEGDIDAIEDIAAPTRPYPDSPDYPPPENTVDPRKRARAGTPSPEQPAVRPRKQ